MFQRLKSALEKLKMNKKVYFIPLVCMALMLMVSFTVNASFDAGFDAGVTKYLSGDLSGCLPLFSEEFLKSPSSPISKGVYGNSLIVFGKRSIFDGWYLDGYTSLEKALYMYPSLKKMRTLSLLTELEDRFPTNTKIATDEQLDSKEEKDMVFDFIFLGGMDLSVQDAQEALDKARENEEDIIVIDNIRYIVHYSIQGETLSSIARAYYKKDLWQKLWKANPDIKNPHRLFPRNRILIPID